ncbi:MAG: ABC transporter permease, partial [Desulfobacterales bacterium]|nr:ABC transporter permease [Desulfobacterales bacterium]
GLLKAKLGINEVISTIMFNYIGLYMINLLIRTVLTAPGILPATPRLPESARLLRFSQIGFLQQIARGSRLNMSIFLAIGAAIFIYWLLWKTTTGYEIRAVGFNSYAAEYGGISVAKNTILALAISGALAGLAGATQVMGVEWKAYQPFGFIGFGMTGIAVALLGKNHPFGVLLSALLFGTLQRGANMMQSMADVPK